jgi:hypothetical protein
MLHSTLKMLSLARVGHSFFIPKTVYG